MKITVVTISFNQSEFLEQTLLSVLNQGYPDLEYIVVDPGSTDGSREIIERYRHRLAEVVYDPDHGAAEGLNHGFFRSTGAVLGFLNSDDLLLPGALAQVARAFALDPALDVVSGHARIIDAQGRWLRNCYTDVFDPRAFAYDACMICQLSTFFRAELFWRTGGFNIENLVAWDAELFRHIFGNAGKRRIIDAILSAFRLHPGAITGGARKDAQLRAYRLSQFREIIGRDWRPYDHVIRWLYLVRKYTCEPRSLWQRLRYGSAYGRFARRAKPPGT
ncbi:MAG: glycosyl transferase, family 2 [Caulobacteraceae bacterium]|nr:glycosyl transferase, family 2 [Caulobacteraceae bacterium]